jgi:AcrR family transcriptional regulator
MRVWGGFQSVEMRASGALPRDLARRAACESTAGTKLSATQIVSSQIASGIVMKKPNRKEEQRISSTEKILTGALELFVRNGYRATTIDQIAAKAGLTKGAIYFYYKTKEAIMLTLLEQARRYVVDPVEGNVGSAGPSAETRLIRFIHGQSMLGLTRPQHVLLLILVSIEFAGTGGEIETSVQKIYGLMYEQVGRLIADGQKDAVFRNDLDARQLTAIVMAGHDGVLLEWHRRPRDLTGRDLTEALREVMLRGVMRRA